MARRVVIGELRVQRIDRDGGRRSRTIVWPDGREHCEADRFLREHDGAGAQRTYAYLLVDHLRWMDRECLALDRVGLRDLQRYMGLLGAEVRMPLGAPWRVGKRPYGPAALSITASCLKGFYLRVHVPWIRSSALRAVAVEESVDTTDGVRAVHAYPRTGSVVVWYSPRRCQRDAIMKAIAAAQQIPADLVPARAPRSADVANADVLRMAIGAVALTLLGLRRYAFARPPLLRPTSRLLATGATIVTGYPFLRGALRSLRGGRSVGTDALVSAATIASLVLRENVVALTVLWLLNIGEYLQDVTLRRTRRAITDLLRGTDDIAWVRTAEGTEVQVRIETLGVGDEVVVHDHVAIPVDGVAIDGDAIIDQSAVIGEALPVAVSKGARVHAGSVVIRGRLVVRTSAVPGRRHALARAA